MQLGLFTEFTEWNDINSDWLYEYLNTNTDLKFKRAEKWKYANYETGEIQEIEDIECSMKNITLSIHIGKTDNLHIWTNPTLVHFHLHKNHGYYYGLGFAVDNMDKFKKSLNEMIEKFKSWVG